MIVNLSCFIFFTRDIIHGSVKLFGLKYDNIYIWIEVNVPTILATKTEINVKMMWLNDFSSALTFTILSGDMILKYAC
jgi:hypothetical protein